MAHDEAQSLRYECRQGTQSCLTPCLGWVYVSCPCGPWGSVSRKEEDEWRHGGHRAQEGPTAKWRGGGFGLVASWRTVYKEWDQSKKGINKEGSDCTGKVTHTLTRQTWNSFPSTKSAVSEMCLPSNLRPELWFTWQGSRNPGLPGWRDFTG